MKPFRERNPVIIGAVSLVVIALLILAAFRADSLPIIGGGKVYHADFTEIGSLKKGSEVRIAGVRVGEVDSISLDNDVVDVGFRVKTDTRFGSDTAAAIRIKTLLGDEYLAVLPNGPGQLDDSDTIPTSRTTPPFDPVQAFSGLASTAQKINTKQLSTSLTTLANLTRNTPQSFRAALSGVSRLSTTIASRNGRINTLLQNLERVSTTLDNRDDDIIHLMRSSRVLFDAVVARRDQIHRILVSTSVLSQQLAKLVRNSRADLHPGLTHLQGVLDVLDKNEDNLDNSIRLLAPFYRVFANTLGTGPWFDTYIFNLPPVPGANTGVS